MLLNFWTLSDLFHGISTSSPPCLASPEEATKEFQYFFFFFFAENLIAHAGGQPSELSICFQKRKWDSSDVTDASSF